jgi:alkanesulfonate monooxygenase SsuD/methylene tetrahydromethanopterin reductase-like flavin-dependent oxidoreductase (luciferase family)
MNTAPLGVLEYLDLSRGTPVADKHRTAFAGAMAAEAIGYRRIWVPEHHGPGSASTNPLPIVAVLGSHTTRARIGTAVSLLRLRDPALTAEDFVTAAAFCGPRLDVGIGRGASAEFLGGLAKDDQQLDRAIEELLDTLASGSALTGPLTEAYELWMHGAGGGSAATAADAGANYCHGLFLNSDLDACLRALEKYRSGGSSGRTAVAVAVAANSDPRQAFADAERQPYAVTTGTAADCAETISNVLHLTGVDEVILIETSSRPDDHLRALREIYDLVPARPEITERSPRR